MFAVTARRRSAVSSYTVKAIIWRETSWHKDGGDARTVINDNLDFIVIPARVGERGVRLFFIFRTLNHRPCGRGSTFSGWQPSSPR